MSKCASNIKAYRKKYHLTQSELASRLFVTKQAVSKWETNRGYPDFEMLPKIAKEFGISIDTLMGENTVSKKRGIRKIIALIILVGIAVSIPLLIHQIQKVKQFNEYLHQIEEWTSFDLPNQGSLVFADFHDWTVYGNTIPIDRMSYFVFKDNQETKQFEEGLPQDEHWKSSLSVDLVECLPLNIQDYAQIGDYYLIYNLDTLAFNEMTSSELPNQYLFLVYQMNEHRLIIFEYSIALGGE